eukprot:14790_1
MSFDFKNWKTKVKPKKKGSCLVYIDKDEVLMFSGYVRVRVKKGTIEINGYCIEASKQDTDAEALELKPYDLYSAPHWKHNCLSMKALCDSQIYLHPFDLGSKYQISPSRKTCDSIFKIVGCHFIINDDDDNEYKPLRVPNSWTKARDFFMNTSATVTHPSMMICGRVQSGKSTFARYFVNCLLNKYSSVAYLDCDVGQSEFNPEGIVSITMIKSPIFGTPHTHQHDMKQEEDKYYRWKSYYYGSNNPADNPSLYLQCISQLYSDWTLFIEENAVNDIPLVMNTHGWVTGLGANILKALMVKLNPTHLIEIHDPQQALLGGFEMDYLAEVKDMFIHQNKSHNWCDEHYQYTPQSTSNVAQLSDNSLVSGWWKQLTTTDELAVKDQKTLKPSQKKWIKYLNHLVELKFKRDDDEANSNIEWHHNINTVKPGKRSKGPHDIELFKTFISAHLHYVESVTSRMNEADEDQNERIQRIIALRKKRKVLSIQKRLLSMASYFTQQLFVDNVAQYLRETVHCYQVPFDDIWIMFQEQNMNVNDANNHGLVLHALNGVMVGLGISTAKDEMICEPPTKKRKTCEMNQDKKWRLNVMDDSECRNRAVECVGLGIIRSINVKKQAFYLITPVHPSHLNKVNVFIRGKTNVPSIFLYDASMLAPPLYINSTPVNERILTSTC